MGYSTKDRATGADLMITIQPGVTEMLRSERTEEAAILLVRGEPGQILATALRAAAADIEELGFEHSPGEVDDPVLVPGGYLLVVQFGADTPPSARATVPGLLAQRMEQAGITDAEICEAPLAGARCKVPDSFTPIARAWLQGSEDRWTQGTRPWLAPRLIDAGAEWLRHEHRPGMELTALVGAVELPVLPETLSPVVSGILGSKDSTAVVASDFATAAASVVFGQFLGCGLALSAAGRDWDASDVTARMRQQREFIRQHAHLPELVWAGVTAEPASFYFTMVDLTRQDYPAIGPVWYQLLSRDQLQQLGQPPAGAVELPGGRVELTIGEPEEWIPGKAAAAMPKPWHGVFSKFRRNTSTTRPEGGQARHRG
jgi:hypothetical protein